MNTHYRFELTVEAHSGVQMRSAFRVEAYVAEECFRMPYDSPSDGMFCEDEASAESIDAQRKELAKEIAGRLTAEIMDASHDLRDGYRC